MSHAQAQRSVFAVPGSSEKMIGKALEFQVDQIFLDLEDAVAPDAKAQARDLIKDRKSTRLNSSHVSESRMPSSA